ncbi:MAG: hypothetical protein DMG67_07665 [Acidobacteria bacterium]|nr:MAG: hypothetical protein DMG67_07665 [Acidobacteriota bacterium]
MQQLRFKALWMCLILMVCLTGTGTAFAQSCLTATAGGPWENAPLASAQSGTFTVTFDATPSASPINSVIALSLGAQTTYAGFATLARFRAILMHAMAEPMPLLQSSRTPVARPTTFVR